MSESISPTYAAWLLTESTRVREEHPDAQYFAMAAEMMGSLPELNGCLWILHNTHNIDAVFDAGTDQWKMTGGETTDAYGALYTLALWAVSADLAEFGVKEGE